MLAQAVEQTAGQVLGRDAVARREIDQLAAETRRLIDKAQAGRLGYEDMDGGTFSVSNLGMFGIEDFDAIINPPQAAILAVASALPQPVVRDGQVTVRTIMRLTLSSDHRVIDGAMAAAFLQTLKAQFENPKRMVL